MPPIDVYRVGELYFVVDGHHRVSVVQALGDTTIEARVRDVQTAMAATRELRLGDLSLKWHERMPRGTDAEQYERLLGEERPTLDEDTMVRQIRRELG